jgi:diketogulonate reductase-like aldo/keto reductase
MGSVLKEAAIDRREVFLQSKVWPTQLGFGPTSRAIAASLQQLGTAYIDQYMLHWPRYGARQGGVQCHPVFTTSCAFRCDPAVEWMHCWDSEDPAGTWRESYRALEKGVAEGRVRSIGVSNFDLRLLSELGQSGVYHILGASQTVRII